MKKHPDGELAEMVKDAYRQIHGPFTRADVANKVLEAHPDVDRADLDEAVNACLDFHDYDFEWRELGGEALRQKDEGRALLMRAKALLDEGEIDEAFRLREQANAKIAEADRLQADYEQMYEAKLEEARRVNELFKASGLQDSRRPQAETRLMTTKCIFCGEPIDADDPEAVQQLGDSLAHESCVKENEDGEKVGGTCDKTRGQSQGLCRTGDDAGTPRDRALR